MCLIIKTDITKPLSQELLEHMAQKNDDGWGMMWIANGQIQVEKMTDMTKLYESYLARAEWEPIIHLRWRTHGQINEHNAHPYYCGNGIFLMHNGTVNAPVTSNNQHSDTWNFIESWIKPLFKLVKNPHLLMRSAGFKRLLEHEIGSQNRIIMGDRGGFVTFNEKAWHTITNEFTKVEGLIVSNTYAWDAHNFNRPKPPPTKVTSITYSGPRRNSLQQVMTHVLGNIYVNDKQEVWTDSMGRFLRAWPLDKRLTEIKEAYTKATSKKDRKELRRNWKNEAKQASPTTSPQAGLSLVTVPTQAELTEYGSWEVSTAVVETTKTTPLLCLPRIRAEASSVEIDAFDAEFTSLANLSTLEYTDILCKEWSQHSTATLGTLVYSQPEDAASIIAHLFNHFYRPGI